MLGYSNYLQNIVLLAKTVGFQGIVSHTEVASHGIHLGVNGGMVSVPPARCAHVVVCTSH